MEMRLLTTESERNAFAQRLADARAGHGASFRDVGRSQARNMVRLAAADIYGLFETESDHVERMTAGVALHDLAIFPQSCQQPDLSRYAPESVLECSDHWSLSRGAGMHAWRGIAVQVVRRNPRAVLVYLAVGRSDHGGFYSAMGFVNAGAPVVYPYLEGPDEGRSVGSADHPRGRCARKTHLKRSSVEDRNSGQLSHGPARQIRPVEAGGEPLSAWSWGNARRIRSRLNQGLDGPADPPQHSV